MLVATGHRRCAGLSDDTELSTLPILVGPGLLPRAVGFLALTVIMLIDLPRVRQGQTMLFHKRRRRHLTEARGCGKIAMPSRCPC